MISRWQATFIGLGNIIGAGKTTTFKMMTGLINPTEGKVLIDGGISIHNDGIYGTGIFIQFNI